MDADCHPHLCCARQHGERICKAKLQKGQRCFVPLGGLDYSLNELCPCDEGLSCVQRKRKSEKSVALCAQLHSNHIYKRAIQFKV
ncbi:dickkopf-related protein 3-like protein [Leptotrombidium deliense]|uniref:Dickkopf-related protein 3-like protein n=1 Tax=Leptotrombidium deliense TaxID=299467 RepID=A0A443SIS6_9ACAR|nr:dickkopf-related protein 3-like protein [Leptotrombidium deliense]